MALIDYSNNLFVENSNLREEIKLLRREILKLQQKELIEKQKLEKQLDDMYIEYRCKQLEDVFVDIIENSNSFNNQNGNGAIKKEM